MPRLRILLDNNIHVDLAEEFHGHNVRHCRDLGWQQLLNGDLVRAASIEFDILVTVDKNMRHQTNLIGINLAVVVFDAKQNTIDELRKFLPDFLKRASDFQPGSFTVIHP